MINQDVIETIENIELAKNNEDIIKTNEENAVIDNSPYSSSLNRLLKLYDEASETLKKKIIEIERKINSISIALPIGIFFIALASFLVNAFITKQVSSLGAILLTISAASMGTGIIINKEKKKKIKLMKKRLKLIESIGNYLEKDLIISKEYNNILYNSQILKHEQFISDKLNLSNTVLDSWTDVYLEESKKNTIIIDCLKTLSDYQKKNYLKKIYSEINKNFEKSNIDLNENNLLLKDDNNTPMLETNTLTNENAKDKGISLNKDNYPINNFNELNNIFNGDPMPPKFQKKQGKKFSKKFPN